jgi:trimethylamine:corrinoid methyltransferase-like protein
MPLLKLLSKSNMDDIHAASLEVLEKVGVIIRNNPALELLRDSGCNVRTTLLKYEESLLRRN